MRDADCVSESAQWTTTSWADHSPGAGRHCRASGGTAANAARRRAGPSAYCWISVSRSLRDSDMTYPTPRLSPQGKGKLWKRSGQVRFAHQIDVDAARGGPALGDGPDDQRLPSLHVPAR